MALTNMERRLNETTKTPVKASAPVKNAKVQQPTSNMERRLMETESRPKAEQVTTSAPKKEGILKKVGKVGNEIVKGIVKLPARAMTNVVQGVAGAFGDRSNPEPFSGKWLGRVSSIGTEGTTKEKLLDMGGAGLEAASYIPLVKTAKLGYQGVKTGLKPVIKPLAKEGALQGVTQGTGQELQNKAETGQDISLKNIGIQAAAGTVLNPAVGLLSRGIGKMFSKNTLAPTPHVEPTVAPKIQPDAPYNPDLDVDAHKAYIETLQLEIDNHPAKKLVNKTGKTGDHQGVLRDLKAKDNTATRDTRTQFEKTGDQTLQETSYNTPDEANVGLDEYRALQKKLKDAKNPLTQMAKTQVDEVLGRMAPEANNVAPITPRAVEGTGEMAVPKLSQSLEDKAIERGLTEGFDDLPETQKMNMKFETQKAMEFAKDYDRAVRSLLGQEKIPNDIIPGRLFKVMGKKALQKGDTKTINELATKAFVPEEATIMGRHIKALDDGDSNDVVGAIRAVNKVWEEVSEKRHGSIKKAKRDIINTESRKFNSEIKKIKPSKQTWNQFIEEIACT